MTSRALATALFRTLLALPLVACSASSSPSPAGSTANAALPDPGACDAGSRPKLDGTCDAVGPHAPVDGFTTADDGWGLAAVRPANACTGATAARLGQQECAPIDDCAAPFPPAGATVLHDGDSVAQAIAAAADGATLALDRGTYGSFTANGKRVHVVGRCASDVIVKGQGKGSGNGVAAIRGGALQLESVTVSGFDDGALVDGASGDFARVLFVANGAGVYADHKASVQVKESIVDGSGRGGTDPIRGVLAFHGSTLNASALDVRALDRAFTAYDPGSVLDVTRSVAVVSPDASQDFVVMAMLQGAIHVHGSYLATTQEPAVIAGQTTRYADSGGPADVLLEDTVVEQKGSYLGGSLMAVMGGGTLTLTGSTVRSQASLAIQAFEDRSRLVATDSVIAMSSSGVPRGSDLFGINVISGGSAELTRSAVAGARGVGISAFDEGSRVALDSSIVTGTAASSTATSGAAFGVAIEKNATASLTESVLSSNEGVSLAAGYAATVSVDTSLVDDARAMQDGSLGEGIVVMADAALAMQGSFVRGTADVALVVMHAKGSVQDTRVVGCSVGVNTFETALRKGTGEPGDQELVLGGVTFERTGTDTQEGEMTFALPDAPLNPGF